MKITVAKVFVSALLLLACKEENSKPEPTAPAPIPGAIPVMNSEGPRSLRNMSPAPGYHEADLRKDYCTVTLKRQYSQDQASQDRTYLVRLVVNSPAPGSSDSLFSVYYVDSKNQFRQSSIVTGIELESSSCDLHDLVQKTPSAVLLADFDVYSDHTFSGEPLCHYSAGLQEFPSYKIFNGKDAWQFEEPRMEQTCPRYTRGENAYINVLPLILNLYPESALGGSNG